MIVPVTPEWIQEAVRALQRGEAVAFPTDTLYGLGAWTFSPAGVQRVFAIKGRAATKALPLLLADASQLPAVVAEVPKVARLLAGHFWPGALTLVLPKARHIPDLVTGGETTVAVRVPDHPIPRELVRRLGGPITGTSANRSGAPSARTAQEVEAQLSAEVTLVLDGGMCPGGHASTVVDCSGGVLRILREGAIPRALLEEVAGAPILAAG